MWRRLKNLWRLSAWEIPDKGNTPTAYDPGTTFSMLMKKPENKMATIIDMDVERQLKEDFPKEQDE